MMRRFLLGVLLWAGIVAPAFAQTCLGTYTSRSAASAAVVAYGGTNWAAYTIVGGSPTTFGACTATIVGAMRFYYSYPNTNYVAMAYDSGACPSGESGVGVGGKCVVPCQYNAAIPASSPSCVPPTPTCTAPQYLDLLSNTCVDPPTCPSGQHADSVTHMCVADTPEPPVGDVKPVSVVMCSANCGEASNWGTWPSTVNDGGWKKEVDSATNCQILSDGTGACNANARYSGGGMASSSSATTTTLTGSSNAPTIVVSCPAGAVVVNGVCEYASTPGTPTTSTTAGTTGTPGATACPVGYAADGKGGCIGTVAPNALGCPAGYNNVNGTCVGSGGPQVYGTGAGGGANAVSSCGGPGQPACNVTLGSPGDLTPDLGSITGANPNQGPEKAGADAFTTGLIGTIGNWLAFDPSRSHQDEFKNGWATYFEPIPMNGCSPFSANIGSYNWHFDLCPIAADVSSFASYAMWIYLAVGVFTMVTGGRR